MKKLLFLFVIISLFSCNKERVDINKSEIIGTWNHGNMTFVFQKDSFRTCNQFGIFEGVYYIAENNAICKTNTGSYLYVQFEKTEWKNKTLFVYWFEISNKAFDVLDKIN